MYGWPVKKYIKNLDYSIFRIIFVTNNRKRQNDFILILEIFKQIISYT